MQNLTIPQEVAQHLLKIQAIQLRPDQPFTWASGWKSPIYCDNRITLSYPKIRTYIRQQLSAVITEKFASPDIIVGVATGGIAQGALVAEDLGLPFAYVRPKPKEHGLGNQIEGLIEAGQRAVVIEDLISTGGSSLNAVQALRDAGVNVVGGGAPGAKADIRIRGGSSLNASNEPLIVLDGLPLSNAVPSGATSILSTIDPNDIESFTVLKDASAAVKKPYFSL